MGVVFRATHLRLSKPVAIKMLLPEALLSPGAVERFDREARAAAQIQSQHVAEVLDVDQHQGLPFMVLEFLEGRDLSNELALRGPLPAHEVVSWLIQVCAAMNEAHRRGIIHRDLKPANLFLAEQEGQRIVKILDFGISKISSPHEARLTATTEGFGTVIYMSPEQVRSTKETDARGDVWSLGVIAYELLTGRLPFQGESATAIIASIIADNYIPLNSLRPDLPAGLVEAVHNTLVKDRNRRTQSMAKLAEALAPFVSDQAPVRLPSVEPVTDDAITLRKTPRLGKRAMWGVAALVMGGLALVGVFMPDDDTQKKAQEPSTRGEEPARSASGPSASEAPSSASTSAPAASSAVPKVTIAPPESSVAPRASATGKSNPIKNNPPSPSPYVPSTKATPRLE
jgi:serine/threonine-protein kinase